MDTVDLTQLIFSSFVVPSEELQSINLLNTDTSQFVYRRYFIPRLLMLLNHVGLHISSPNYEVASELIGLFVGMTTAKHVTDYLQLNAVYLSATHSHLGSIINCVMIHGLNYNNLMIEMYQVAVDSDRDAHFHNPNSVDQIFELVNQDFLAITQAQVQRAVDRMTRILLTKTAPYFHGEYVSLDEIGIPHFYKEHQHSPYTAEVYLHDRVRFPRRNIPEPRYTRFRRIYGRGRIDNLPQFQSRDFNAISMEEHASPIFFSSILNFTMSRLNDIVPYNERSILLRFVDGVLRNFEKHYNLEIVLKLRAIQEKLECLTVYPRRVDREGDIYKTDVIPMSLVVQGNIYRDDPLGRMITGSSQLNSGLLLNFAVTHLTEVKIQPNAGLLYHSKHVTSSPKSRSIGQSLFRYFYEHTDSTAPLNILGDSWFKIRNLYHGSMECFSSYILGQILSPNENSPRIQYSNFKYDDDAVNDAVDTFVLSKHGFEDEPEEAVIFSIVRDQSDKKRTSIDLEDVGLPELPSDKYITAFSILVHKKDSLPDSAGRLPYDTSFVDYKGNMLRMNTFENDPTIFKMRDFDHLNFVPNIHKDRRSLSRKAPGCLMPIHPLRDIPNDEDKLFAMLNQEPFKLVYSVIRRSIHALGRSPNTLREYQSLLEGFLSHNLNTQHTNVDDSSLIIVTDSNKSHKTFLKITDNNDREMRNDFRKRVQESAQSSQHSDRYQKQVVWISIDMESEDLLIFTENSERQQVCGYL